MSQRFPANEATPGHLQILEEQLHKLQGEDLPFEWKGQDDALFGPYPALLHSPDITPKFWAMAQVCFSPDTVKPRNRELAILGMLSIISAPFVLYAHRLIAFRLGITDDQYTTGLQGSTPADLNGEEKMAYCLGRVLADLKGPLGDEVWAEAIHEMGRKEALGVVHAVGSYVYICMLTNVNGRDDRFG